MLNHMKNQWQHKEKLLDAIAIGGYETRAVGRLNQQKIMLAYAPVRRMGGHAVA